jgi:COP9 signalosome complex subunit 1
MEQLPPKRDSRASITALDSLDPETFDWKAYNGTYKGMLTDDSHLAAFPLTAGRALITRLLFIADLILNESTNASPKAISIARAAASQAIPLLKETWDTENYYRAVSFVAKCISRAPGAEPMDVDSASACAEAQNGKPDQSWAAQTGRNAKAETSRLNVELNGYMSNLIKESIRVSCLRCRGS